MPKLEEVFGIAASVSSYTYVDRAGLDNKFTYLVNNARHLVIHGASKQGKTSLRRKNLPEEQCVVVQCRADSTLEQTYLEILRQIGTKIPKEIVESVTIGAEVTGKASGGVKIPFLASSSAELEGSSNIERSSERVTEPVGMSSSSLGYIAEEIKKINKKIIIEDFHYLLEDEKKRLAFDLKAFWDHSVFFIIVGIWAEQNLFIYYNGDLSGRVEEIDIQWTDEELGEVLSKGEKALNIVFGNDIRQDILSDANQNVGLLQRITEKYCFETGVFESKRKLQTVNNRNVLDKCRTDICNQEAVRYRQFGDAVSRGYKGYDGSELKVYQHIVRVCIESSDAEICNGLHRDTLLARIRELEPRVRLSDLSAALNKLDKLQANRSISPLVISYNIGSRKVQLVDRELLFYRKYGNPTWPWQETED